MRRTYQIGPEWFGLEKTDSNNSYQGESESKDAIGSRLGGGSTSTISTGSSSSSTSISSSSTTDSSVCARSSVSPSRSPVPARKTGRKSALALSAIVLLGLGAAVAFSYGKPENRDSKNGLQSVRGGLEAEGAQPRDGNSTRSSIGSDEKHKEVDGASKGKAMLSIAGLAAMTWNKAMANTSAKGIESGVSSKLKAMLNKGKDENATLGDLLRGMDLKSGKSSSTSGTSEPGQGESHMSRGGSALGAEKATNALFGAKKESVASGIFGRMKKEGGVPSSGKKNQDGRSFLGNFRAHVERISLGFIKNRDDRWKNTGPLGAASEEDPRGRAVARNQLSGNGRTGQKIHPVLGTLEATG